MKCIFQERSGPTNNSIEFLLSSSFFVFATIDETSTRTSTTATATATATATTYHRKYQLMFPPISTSRRRHRRRH